MMKLRYFCSLLRFGDLGAVQSEFRRKIAGGDFSLDYYHTLLGGDDDLDCEEVDDRVEKRR
jgi:hypothetical protein